MLRAGRPADAPLLAALATQVFLHTYATQGISDVIAGHVLAELSPAKFQAWMASDTAAVLVAERNAHLVGYARLAFDAVCPVPGAGTVELTTLYVQEHFTGRGVGTALLAQAEALAWQHKQRPLWLTVNAQNARALAFYAAQGCSRIGSAQFVLGGESHPNHVLVMSRRRGAAHFIG
ncbi:MAG: GNAT family N-acetyltransferase [Burkholderiaceae bacterium]